MDPNQPQYTAPPTGQPQQPAAPPAGAFPNQMPAGQQAYQAPTTQPMMAPARPMPAVNPEATYGTQLGGILSYLRWSAIVGGVIMIVTAPMILIGSGLFALLGMSASMFGYADVAITSLIQSLSLVALLVFAIIMAFRVAKQIKNRDYRVYDTFLTMSVVYFAYDVIYEFLRMAYYFDDFGYYASRAIPVFLWGIVWSIISIAVGVCVWTAYFSKSKRVFAWFNTRPVQASRFYGIISKLPSFIIDDKIPNFGGGTPPPPLVNPLVQQQPQAGYQQPAPVAYTAPQMPQQPQPQAQPQPEPQFQQPPVPPAAPPTV